MASVVLDAAPVYDRWQYLHQDNFVAPSGAAAMVLCMACSDRAREPEASSKPHFDVVYFTPAPGRF